MPRFTCVSLLLFLFVTLLQAAESKMSADAIKAEAEYQEKVARIMFEAQKEIDDQKADLKRSLEKELKDVMRDGDLEKAQALKELMENIEEEDPLYREFGKQSLLVKQVEKEEKIKHYRVKVIAAVVSIPMSPKKHYVQNTVQKHIDDGNYEINPSKLLGEETGVRFGRLHLSYTINGGKNIVEEIPWHRSFNIIPEEREGE